LAQKAVLLVKVKGPDAFAPRYSTRLLRFIKKLFGNAYHVRPLKMAFAPVVLFVILNIYAYSQYLQDIKWKQAIKAPDTLIAEIRGSQTPYENEKSDYLNTLLHAQSLYYAGDYQNSFSIFRALDSLIIEASTLSEHEKATWRREALFFEGMSSFMIWMDKNSGYWRWMGNRLRRVRSKHQIYLQKAYDAIDDALTLARLHDLPQKEREIYYKALIRQRLGTNSF
jgi:hypothetical protein